MAQPATDVFPPLPEEVTFPLTDASKGHDDFQESQSQLSGVIPPLPVTTVRLKKGTWLFSYQSGLSLPLLRNTMDGTLRFEGIPGSALIRASGDMYKRPLRFIPGHQVGGIFIPPTWLPGSAPATSQGIPILPLDQYDGYLRVTSISILLNGNSFDMEFDKYKWNSNAKAFILNAAGTPVVQETFVARLTWTTAPAGWPSPADYLTGDVKIKSTGVVAGQIQMGWVSEKWRKIGLEIDAVWDCYFPSFNTARRSVWQLLEDAGFQIAKKTADENNIADTPTSVWTEAELHAAMLIHRQSVDLNKEWTYHALIVPKFEDPTVLGVMYDDVATQIDTNKVAREGFAVAAHLQTGTAERWGTEANRLLQDAQDSFVRTTIHELSHAMGMHHPNAYFPLESQDNTYMCQTKYIQQNAVDAQVPYPSNVLWYHSRAVQTRLRHYPDVRIRPGGVSFGLLNGTNGSAPWIPPNDVAPPIPGLQLDIEPVLSEIPLGAPIRLEVTLSNRADFSLQVPKEIGLKGDAMRGDVEDPSGIRRPFQPLVICDNISDDIITLEPQKSITTSITLLAGNNGPLFPVPGVHTITANLSWDQPDKDAHPISYWIDAKTTVMVTGAYTASHAAAAHRVLAEPQTFLSLVLAGDHLHNGNEAIEQACHDETLGPHFAYVKARRHATRFMDRKPDLDRAREIVDRGGIVMSKAERRKADGWSK